MSGISYNPPAKIGAWASGDGAGTPTVRQGFNVSSMTSFGPGDKQFNFSTALPHADYSATFCVGSDSGSSGSGAYITRIVSQSTTAARFQGNRADTGAQAGMGQFNMTVVL
jgi:hypothetical protein